MEFDTLQVTERKASPSLDVSRCQQHCRTSLTVCVHDVAPLFLDQLREICAALRPLLGTQMAAAVVPRWGGTEVTPDDVDFVQLVRDNFGDLLLHGSTHQNTSHRGLVARLTGDADEFRRLSPADIEQRIAEGQAILARVFTKQAIGFAPPAWQTGKLTPQILARHGLSFCLGLRSIAVAQAFRLPAATWSWDLGVVPGSGYLGEAIGSAAHFLRRGALPVVVVHPLDVDRGYLPRAVRVIRSLLDAGRRPVLFSQLLSGDECETR